MESVKKLKKNQIMITALAIMIGVAGYLNFAGTKIGEDDFLSFREEDDTLTDIVSLDSDVVSPVDNYLADSEDGLTTDNELEVEVPGEAIFTSTTAIDKLAGAKLLKEQTRAASKDTLMEIINSEDLTENAKKDAIAAMITLTDIATKETDAQMLLEAKGYKEAVVSISNDAADVMIGATKLTDAQTAQIIDIVQRKTGIAAENIIITVSDT